MSIVKSITTSARPIALRGGRMRKRGGQVVSFAPHFSDLLSGASRVALGGILILSGVAALSPSIAMAEPVAQRCAGTTTIICSGPADPDGEDAGIDIQITEPNTTIVTAPGFGIDTSNAEQAGPAIKLTSNDEINVNINFIDTNESSITGEGGIVAVNTGEGNTSVTTTGNVSGGNHAGVYVLTDNEGDVHITTSGSISGYTGIYADTGYNAEGNLIIANSADITTDHNTIFAVHNGAGHVSINTSGNLISDSNAIYAAHWDDGNISIINAGTIKAAYNGIMGSHGEVGNLSISNSGTIEAGFVGIRAYHDYIGNITITNSGSVTSHKTADLQYSGGTSIDTTSNLSGYNAGIIALHDDWGNITITNSDVISVSLGMTANLEFAGTPVYDENLGKDILVTRNNSVDFNGYTVGIGAIHLNEGDISITNSGQITASASLAGSINFAGDAIYQNDVDLSVEVAGIAAQHFDVGNITITNSGTITAQLDLDLTATYGEDSYTLNDGYQSNDAFAHGIRVQHGEEGNWDDDNDGQITVLNSGTIIADSDGVNAYHFGSGGITLTNTGIISADSSGITAVHYGEGNISVTNTGTITSADSDGIDVYHGGYDYSDITITNTGTISAHYDGVRAYHNGGGNISVTNTGTIISSDSDGIDVYHDGYGDISVTNTGTITSMNGDGIDVFHDGYDYSDITITNTATGTITSDDHGIELDTWSDGNITIQNAGIMNAGDDGIDIGHRGDGNIDITNTGSITARDIGIDAYLVGDGTITVNNSGTIKSGDAAIDLAIYGEGDVTITNSGKITGSDAAIWASTNDGDISITNTGTMANSSGNSADLAILAGPDNRNAYGSLEITNSGTITGTVTTTTTHFYQDEEIIHSFDDTVINNGTWNTAGGSNEFGVGYDLVTNNAILNGAKANFNGVDLFVNNGTLSLANNASGDTLFIEGDLELNASGNLILDFAGSSTDLVDTGGNVVIDGSTLTLNAVGPRSARDRYTLVSGTLVTGQFGANNLEDTAFLDLELDYTDTSVDLVATQVVDFADVATTPNQRAVTKALDGMLTPVQMLGRMMTPFAIGPDNVDNVMLGEILYLPTAAAANNAFDQLSGEAHASLRSNLADDSRLSRNAVLNRLQNREGSAIWGEIFYGAGDLSQAKNRDTGNNKRDAWGAILGVDAKVTENVTVGFAASLINHESDQQSRLSKLDAETVTLLAYVGAEAGKARFKLGAGYASSDVNTARSISFGRFSDRLNANYDASQLQGFAEVGYRLPLGGGYVEPMANVIYVDTTTDGFTEKGGLAALTAAKRSESTTLSTLGARFSTAQSGIFSLSGMAGWQHGFGKLTPTSVMMLEGSESFTVAGAAQSRNAAVASLEAKFDVGETTSIGLGYDGVLGNAGQDHAAKVSFRLKF